ncbi:Uma2 family endonuclease [Dehalococcoidia bacterium]|nr:Uma2 family endonuclease [Dehalococcoidia bacterium]MCL0088091.1 Uma2 family endonuclease [Dehalococcoidia bacterium]MCL0097533.1 Uma2 family endonuclease [Dehalococcoidia bacterium]
MTIQMLRRLFTVEEYHSMVRAGILGEDDRVELIEGEVEEMTPIGSRHVAAVNRLNRLFSDNVGRRAIISVQNPIRLGERSEPQPDLALLRPRPDFYSPAHPGPEDILLVIEVAETSADYDRVIKVPLYARGGILEVWLVNLEGEAIEVYQSPSLEGYHEMETLRRGDRLSPSSFPELRLAVEEILS